MTEPNVALIVGVTGICGSALARRLVAEDCKGAWVVYGLSRKPGQHLPNDVIHIKCDLTDRDACIESLKSYSDITHVFYATWQKGANEEEMIKVNSAMFENLFDALPGKLLKHVALVTGTKHYMGPFSYYSDRKVEMITPWKEIHKRLPIPNFYYSLEDILFERVVETGFTWSVARPHIMIGFAVNNAMNMASSIAVYASLCKYLKKPFAFPGTSTCYNVVLDATDASLLAEHLLWEVSTPEAANQAFNVTNGDCFRWKHLWKAIADYFAVEVPEHSGQPINMKEAMKDVGHVWQDIVSLHKLKDIKVEELATWWLLDISMHRAVDGFADMTKSKELGFLGFRNTHKSFFAAFDYLQKEKYIP